MRANNSGERFFWAGLFFIGLSLGIVLPGCKRLSSEAKQLLSTAALATRERAASFRLISDQIQAGSEKDQAAVARYVKAHREGLASEAKALSDFVEAAQKGGFDKASREALQLLAENAAGRAKAWAAIRPKLRAPNFHGDDWDHFKETHGS